MGITLSNSDDLISCDFFFFFLSIDFFVCCLFDFCVVCGL